MISSMTGFGRGETEDYGKNITIEIKSVNHRFLESVVRYPRTYSFLEERIKAFLKSKFERGRIDVFVSIEDSGEKKRQLCVDKELAIAYHEALEDIADILKINGNVKVIDLAKMPDVVKIEEAKDDIEEIWKVALRALEEATKQLAEMRKVEGEALGKDILVRKDSIFEQVAYIETRADLVVLEYKEKLHKRIQELLQDIPIDENRLALEIAVFADRANITEEIVRLRSHLLQLEDIILSGGTVGRKIDFLIQEMFREINTIGSKANDIKISNSVVNLKSEIEKIREQIQNIE